MLPLLSFHALVAHRGDGLRPELLALLQRDSQPQMPPADVSQRPTSIQKGAGAGLIPDDPAAD
ncbi:hypothetical protein [Caballeronia sp. 15715]|jgi:hypothetical protein|uniref:hypothetical protein n=1 Tax=unclassified Caballeronia TaxID=2646786 RepID=UPI0039E22F8D